MQVSFTITGVRNARGMVRGLAFDKERGFPEERSLAIAEAETRAVAGSVVLTFQIPSSHAAFCFFHDEKNRGRIEKNFLGIPKSGVTVSNWNGRGRPKFKNAYIKVGRSHTAQLKYIFD